MPIGGFPALPALTPEVVNRAGAFCDYTVTYDPAAWTLKFVAHANGKTYDIALDADYPAKSRTYFEPPWHRRQGQPRIPISQFFVLNPNSAKDWIVCPELQKNAPPRQDVKSFGHGRGPAWPVRIQIGNQEVDNQHSGSGLLHLMLSHDKDSIQQVYDVIKNIFDAKSIGAIYRTKVPVYGFTRYLFLSRSNTPNCLVVELHGDFFRVITLYKVTNFSNYNKFKQNKDEYQLVYSWDRDRY